MSSKGENELCRIHPESKTRSNPSGSELALLSDLISLAHIEKGASVAQGSTNVRYS